MSRVVGVVPAAGHGTRLGLRSGSKEMLAVDGRPIMDVLLDRLRRAPCDEIRVVIRPEKRDVAAHARARGAHVVEGRPDSVSASLLLGLSGLEPDDVVLFGFPDALWDPEDGFTRLLKELRAGTAPVVLGVFANREPERSDVVELVDDGWVRRIQVKPAEPVSRLIWGCAATTAGVLGPGLADEPEPGKLFDRLARESRVRGVRLGTFRDVGTPEALAEVRRDLR